MSAVWCAPAHYDHALLSKARDPARCVYHTCQVFHLGEYFAIQRHKYLRLIDLQIGGSN